MTYSKPEVKNLGQATVVIENSTIKQPPRFTDGTPKLAVLPAYDLDE